MKLLFYAFFTLINSNLFAFMSCADEQLTLLITTLDITFYRRSIAQQPLEDLIRFNLLPIKDKVNAKDRVGYLAYINGLERECSQILEDEKVNYIDAVNNKHRCFSNIKCREVYKNLTSFYTTNFSHVRQMCQKSNSVIGSVNFTNFPLSTEEMSKLKKPLIEYEKFHLNEVDPQIDQLKSILRLKRFCFEQISQAQWDDIVGHL
jgi:hypothetical protein